MSLNGSEIVCTPRHRCHTHVAVCFDKLELSLQTLFVFDIFNMSIPVTGATAGYLGVLSAALAVP